MHTYTVVYYRDTHTQTHTQMHTHTRTRTHTRTHAHTHPHTHFIIPNMQSIFRYTHAINPGISIQPRSEKCTFI